MAEKAGRTVLTTFGFSHGEPPKADITFDARTVAHHDLDAWEQAASDWAGQFEDGQDVAIGCEDGDDRSVHIARFIQKLRPDILVVDRDLYPGAGNPPPKALKGDSKGVISENVRSAKHAGMSEADAVRSSAQAARQPVSAEQEV